MTLSQELKEGTYQVVSPGSLSFDMQMTLAPTPRDMYSRLSLPLLTASFPVCDRLYWKRGQWKGFTWPGYLPSRHSLKAPASLGLRSIAVMAITGGCPSSNSHNFHTPWGKSIMNLSVQLDLPRGPSHASLDSSASPLRYSIQNSTVQLDVLWWKRFYICAVLEM